MSKLTETALQLLRDYVQRTHNGNVRTAAADLGINYQTLYKWLNNERKPQLSKIEPFLDKIGLEFNHDNTQHLPNLYPINIHAIAGAGPAWELESSEPLTQIMVPPDFLAKASFALQIEGESMYPTIKNNAIVGIKEEHEFIPNEIYAIRLPYEGLAIKRISINHATKTYIIRSDNQDQNKYPPQEISIEGNPYFIVGRVVWVWQVA